MAARSLSGSNASRSFVDSGRMPLSAMSYLTWVSWRVIHRSSRNGSIFMVSLNLYEVCGEIEVDEQRADVGDREHDRAGGNLRVEFGRVQERRQQQAEQRGGHHRHRDRTADGHREMLTPLPTPGNQAHDRSASQS